MEKGMVIGERVGVREMHLVDVKENSMMQRTIWVPLIEINGKMVDVVNEYAPSRLCECGSREKAVEGAKVLRDVFKKDIGEAAGVVVAHIQVRRTDEKGNCMCPNCVAKRTAGTGGGSH
jgi:hypothetical protein